MDHQPTLAGLVEQGNFLELQRRLDCGEDVNSPDVVSVSALFDGVAGTMIEGRGNPRARAMITTIEG